MSTWEERLQDSEIQATLKFINSTPECLSILYDLDLLPEQTMKEPRLFMRTMAFAGLLRRNHELENVLARVRCCEDAYCPQCAEEISALNIPLP